MTNLKYATTSGSSEKMASLEARLLEQGFERVPAPAEGVKLTAKQYYRKEKMELTRGHTVTHVVLVWCEDGDALPRDF
jgi:hypothetical protein